MPIHPNQDYWHKINELWEKQAQNETAESQGGNESPKTQQKPTALSGWRYLYKQDQLSHNEAENITDEWCEIGGNMLLNSVLALANSTNSHYNTPNFLMKDK